MPARHKLDAPDRSVLAGIQLVFSDLDETLLMPDHRIGQRSQAAIRGLIQKGVQVVICTGRAPEATRPLVNQIGGRYYICNNGATVYDGEHLLLQSTLAPEIAGQMAAFFAEHECPTYLMTPAGYGVTAVTPEIEAANRARGVWPRVLTPEEWVTPAHKVMPWGAARLYQQALARWGDVAKIIYHPDYLEIGPVGVSKASAAQQLAAKLDVPSHAVAAIGDALNDTELIQWAGLGVAMGNGNPELQQMARWVVGDYADDGAADLFEALLQAYSG